MDVRELIMKMRSFGLLLGGVVAMALFAGSALAAPDPYFPNFHVPDFFSQPNTSYQEWNSFSSPAGPNAAVAVSNASGTPDAYDATAATDGAFLISGRIYSPTGVTHPVIVVPSEDHGAGWATRLSLQVQTRGSVIDTNTVQVTPVGGSAAAPSSIELLSHTPLGGFGGFQDEYQFLWDLPGNAASYTFTFNSAESSMSWAGARVDTLATVPEPASAGLLAVLAGTLLMRRRSARQ